MSFGLCPHTNLSFAEKFHVGVYESLPAPSAVTSAVQFQRALEFEKEHLSAECNLLSGNCPEKHKYFFVMINRYDDIGGIYPCPAGVKEMVFKDSNYPASFRWFVIDPRSREEVLFIRDEMEGFPLCHPRLRDEWWFDLVYSNEEIEKMNSLS